MIVINILNDENQFERVVGVARFGFAHGFGFSMIRVVVGINANVIVIKLKDESIDFKQFEIQNKRVEFNEVCEDNRSNAFKNKIEENSEFIK